MLKNTFRELTGKIGILQNSKEIASELFILNTKDTKVLHKGHKGVAQRGTERGAGGSSIRISKISKSLILNYFIILKYTRL